MKKLGTALIIAALTVKTVCAAEFTDIKEGMWAEETITRLVEDGVINGYSDGTFKPYKTIKVDEFIKLIMTQKGYNLQKGEKYWASNYINKAVQLGYFEAGDFVNGYKVPIKRNEMASMIIKALNEPFPLDLSKFEGQLGDYRILNEKYKESIIKAYYKGIITGYPDGEFKEDNEATRAEAATMILRMVDPKERKETPDKGFVGRIEDENFKRLNAYPTDAAGSYLNFFEYSQKYGESQLDEKLTLMVDYIYLENNFDFELEQTDYQKKITNFVINPLNIIEANVQMKKKIVGSFETNKNLFYRNKNNELVLRCVVKYKYASLENDKLVELNKEYIRDVEYIFSETESKLLFIRKEYLN